MKPGPMALVAIRKIAPTRAVRRAFAVAGGVAVGTDDSGDMVCS
jgi:hypothetical protein